MMPGGLHPIPAVLAAFLAGFPATAGAEPLASTPMPASAPALPAASALKAGAAEAPKSRMDGLFDRLRGQGPGWKRAEADILRIWSHSGSAALDYLRLRGERALDAGDTDEAIGHLTALTDHAPDYAEGFQLRAAAYRAAGLYGPAADDLARALAIEPRQFLALTQLGDMLEEIGDRPRALAAYQASLAIHPHQQEALDAVARLRRALDGTAL